MGILPVVASTSTLHCGRCGFTLSSIAVPCRSVHAESVIQMLKFLSAKRSEMHFCLEEPSFLAGKSDKNSPPPSAPAAVYGAIDSVKCNAILKMCSTWGVWWVAAMLDLSLIYHLYLPAPVCALCIVHLETLLPFPSVGGWSLANDQRRKFPSGGWIQNFGRGPMQIQWLSSIT